MIRHWPIAYIECLTINSKKNYFDALPFESTKQFSNVAFIASVIFLLLSHSLLRVLCIQSHQGCKLIDCTIVSVKQFKNRSDEDNIERL